ncbi:MAG: hypothetical protein HYY25_02775 [Candidatus Wallbacteria bacterium]|nr:hypothetical protein [Candidatus Wallbacteria bacterium]MBI4865928.1 hypothetical protein [Candidatus Wallbacteria bacterium]
MKTRAARAALWIALIATTAVDFGCKAEDAQKVQQALGVAQQVTQMATSLQRGGNQTGPAAPLNTFNGNGSALTNGSPTLTRDDQTAANGANRNGPAAPDTSGGTTTSAKGKQIADVAGTYVNRDFQYDPATNGGRKGCAQVVSTILQEAGAMSGVRLGVLDVLSDLRGRGWGDVQPPPWADGDVVTWATYDRDGDGSIDPDTHIGIVRIIDGVPYAVNNSSSQRMPVQRELASLPWRTSHVLRQS